MREASVLRKLRIQAIVTLALLSTLGADLTASAGRLTKGEKCVMKNQQKNIPIHRQVLQNKISAKWAAPDSATITWKALEGAEVYRVFVNDARIADRGADPGPTVEAPCAEPGTILTATVGNLRQGVPYNIYIRAERGGKYFAYLQGVDITGSC